MADFIIPCGTFVRLASVLVNPHKDANEWFNSVRLDNGIAVASNRVILAAESIGGQGGVVHIIADPALIEQCRKEAPFKSTLTITVNEMLKFAVAKTTLGYVHPGNCAVWSDEPNDFNKWRDIVEQARKPATKPYGGMFWDADQIACLAAASPSGRVIFEEIIDTSRPTIIRDINDHEWFGMFLPHDTEVAHIPAKLPSWMI